MKNWARQRGHQQHLVVCTRVVSGYIELMVTTTNIDCVQCVMSQLRIPIDLVKYAEAPCRREKLDPDEAQ